MKAIKIIGGVVVIIVCVIGVILLNNTCNQKIVADQFKVKYDSLLTVLEERDKEIKKLDELVTYYAGQYDSTAKINDSLADQGLKTITKYKTIKVQGDTSELVAICDSLATEYERFIDQTKETLAAADSVIKAQGEQVNAYEGKTQTLEELVKTLKDKITEQEREIDKWRKLAKRRGRALEW